MTSSSTRKGIVRIGGVIYDTLSIVTRRELITYTVNLGVRTEQNLYIVELTVMAMAIRRLLYYLVGRQITIFMSNLGVLLTVN